MVKSYFFSNPPLSPFPKKQTKSKIRNTELDYLNESIDLIKNGEYALSSWKW
jgi:hypothetical protein